MNKIVLLLVFCVSTSVFCQNLQLHHDFEREHFTTTFELFKMDKYGNTFTFIDFDYNAENGINQGYFEIARVLKTEKIPVGLHVEYNGGVGMTPNFGYSINAAWIFGVNYSKGTANWGFSTYAGYKSFKNAGEANYQITGTWYWHLLNSKLTLTGFADVWTENGDGLSGTTVFLAEPQVWYNLNKTFSIGGEVELSNNFAYTPEFKVRPTLGIKWNI